MPTLWRRGRRPVGWSVVAQIVTAVVAFTVVGVGASIVAGRIAKRDALEEALRTAHALSTVFAPLIPGAIRGEPQAVKALDEAVRAQSQDGALVRIKIWARDGTVIYSDDHVAIGHRYPLHTDVADAIDHQRSSADLSGLTNPENTTEVGRFRRLVEVYIPLVLKGGTKVAFEMYAADTRVRAAEKGLRRQLVPFALLALLVLVVSQLPVSIWLVRRVGRAHTERRRLLESALTASARERRAVAQDLHDGVVQDLAGASYAIQALQDTMAPAHDERSRNLVATVSRVLGEAVGSLRSLVVAIYPPDLSSHGLARAITEIGERMAPRTVVTTSVDLDTELEPATSALLYRCARECLANIAKHARAPHAEVRLVTDDGTVRLTIRDDGIGLPVDGVNKHAEGHVGLQLVADTVHDAGGRIRLQSAPGGGTTVLIEVPIRALMIDSHG